MPKKTIKPKIDTINFTALAMGGSFIAGAATFPGMPAWLAAILGVIGYGLTAIGGTVDDEDYVLPESGKEAARRYRKGRRIVPGALVLFCALLMGCGGWQLGSVTHEATGASVSVDGDEIEVDAISEIRVCMERGSMEVCEAIRPSVYWLRSEGTLYLCVSHRMLPPDAACVPIPVNEGDEA